MAWMSAHPLFQPKVRCTGHGPFFARLRYFSGVDNMTAVAYVDKLRGKRFWHTGAGPLCVTSVNQIFQLIQIVNAFAQYMYRGQLHYVNPLWSMIRWVLTQVQVKEAIMIIVVSINLEDSSIQYPNLLDQLEGGSMKSALEVAPQLAVWCISGKA